MARGRKVVLHCPRGCTGPLDAMIGGLIRDGVTFVGVVGQDCQRIEDMIDDIVIGGGSGRFILTSSHPGESLDEAVAFARLLSGDYADGVEIIEL